MLLACIFLQVAGFYLVFVAQRAAIRQEVKAWLRTHQQEQAQHVFLLSLDGDDPSDPAIEWEGDDEFSFNNEMYDVIEKKRVGNHWQIRCISDRKETILVKKFEKNLSANTTHKNPANGNGLVKLITAPFIAGSTPPVFVNPLQLNVYHDTFSLYLPRVIFDIPTPPPQAG